MLGMHGARFTNEVLEECDLLVALGARFDDRATGKISEFCPRAKIVHADIDAAELNKLRRADVALASDVGAVLEELVPRVRPRLRARWLERVAQLKRDYPLQMPGVESPKTPYGLVAAVAAAAGEDALVTTDVGQHQMWVAQAYPLRRPRQLLTSGGLGTMGFGLPAAIGAALAAPHAPVVCFSGDGSLLMNVQELATAAEVGVNVKIVLLDNASLGLVHQQQTLFYGGRTFASRYRHAPDFIRIAQGFGIDCLDLGSLDEVGPALQERLRRRGPCLIRARIDAAAQVLPMVPPGAANREMIG